MLRSQCKNSAASSTVMISPALTAALVWPRFGRPIFRILEIEAKIAGRIESNKVEVNLNSIKIDLVTDEQIEAFLQRLDQDRRSRIVGRQIDRLITDTDVERIQNGIVARRLGVTPDELPHLREWIAEYRNTRGPGDY